MQSNKLINAVNSTTTLLSVRNLFKKYQTKVGDTVDALTDIHLDLMDGEFVSVLGPSGCGKTTLLKILAGIVQHSSGEVMFKGQAIADSKNVMGVVFQSPVLLPWLTVLDNVLLPLRVLGMDRNQYLASAISLIELVGLHGFENKYPNELSGGMQQRVSIVRALIHDPGILLMDEPFGALDSLTRERMNSELQKIWLIKKKTIFFITHSISEAVFFSDRVIVMSARPGKIIEEIRIDFPRPRHIDLTSTQEFGAIAKNLRGCLGSYESGHE
jgi:NitT/TauT family transport system ATP-binding protein